MKRFHRILEERDEQVKSLSEQLVTARDRADDAERSLEYSSVRLREAERRVNSLQDLLASYRLEEQLAVNSFDSAKARELLGAGVRLVFWLKLLWSGL